jgi:hypothetical protein
MMRRVFSIYQRKRIVNINANIIAAGFLAIGLSKAVVHFTYALVPDGTPLFFTIVAVVSDMIFDVAIYYALHWIANHWKPFTPRSERDKRHLENKPPPFFKDASLVQFERMILSPVYYLIAAGLMYTLQKNAGLGPGLALLIAFPVGLLTTRLIHTWYGIKTGRFNEHGGFKPRAPKSADTTHEPKPALPEDVTDTPDSNPTTRHRVGAPH